MVTSRFLFRCFAVFAFTLLLGFDAQAQVFADVTVEGAVSGTFTMSLEYQKKPGAVANFVGLATGRRGWVDRTTGAIRYDGFYNGVTFHRVIAGFVSQTGSRAGDGTDGPGYTFRNEIDASLTHNAAYVVAMANSGKDTNGSQFYITAAAQPSLDGSYTVFGHVTAGMAICDAINATPTTGSGDNPANRPLTAIKISSITVYGPSYAGLSLTQAALLPVLQNARPVVQKTGSSLALNYDHAGFSEYFGFLSSDLGSWSRFASGYFASAPTGTVDLSSLASAPRYFFRLGRADYTACHTSPVSVGGKTLSFPAIFGTVVKINAAGNGGTVTYDGLGGATKDLITASYSPGIYTGTMDVSWQKSAQANAQLAFDRLDYNAAGTGGTYVARTSEPGYGNVSGSFTSTP